MDSPLVVWILRLLHIQSGVFWVGSVMIFARFIFPAAKAIGPAAAPLTNYMTQVLKLPVAMLGSGIVTVVSGFFLYWRDSGGFQPAWMKSGMGTTLGIGAVLAIAALAIGMTVNTPTVKRMGALGAAIAAQGAPPSPEQSAEMQRLQARLGAALRVVATLLVLSTAAMALARYV